MKYILFINILLVVNFNSLFAQNNLYDVDTIREIKIYFTESDWDYFLDSFYVAGLEERLIANVRIDGVAYDSVGIRYKGFSSVSINRIKNPFNIKLDYIKNQNHNGIEKLKLGNVIQDPSFVREVLSYEICRKYMPASKANYADLYINDVFWGLYSNVESVNKAFLAKHFGSKENSFFKCAPENLNLFGENANLSNSPGTDSASYYTLYDLKSDYGWSDLYNLIDILNNNPDSIENILNVDRTLWMHAINYSLINFDSYVGYAQNYYLYEDNNGRFNPLIWDLNMSFASYRLADASIHFSGFNIQEAKEMDPLLHYNNVSVYPRPLMRNLFVNERYRKMYLAHMRTIMQENFNNQDYSNRAQNMQNLIDVSVANDTNKFYSYTDFTDNLNVTVTDLIDYPGITDLMDARAIYLNTYPGFQGHPLISDISTSSASLSLGGNITVTARVTDADTVILAYRYAANDLFTKVMMLDDGSQNDGISGDSIYGFQLTGTGNELQYYVYADNDSAGVFSPQRAAYEYYSLQSQVQAGDLVINEFMATNKTVVRDENGDFDDWIELYNNSQNDISLAGLFLSDSDTNITRFALPSVVIPAGDYLIIWPDEDTLDGELHANFRITGNGEQIILAYDNNTIIDSVHYPSQINDISMARYPNGTGNFIYRIPTFNANNDFTAISEIKPGNHFNLFPNPANKLVYLDIKDPQESLSFELIDMNGRTLFSKYINNCSALSFDVSDYSKGLYFVRMTKKNSVYTKKLIIH
jgi:spore coat protein CotH